MGNSNQPMDDPAQAIGLSAISGTQVSRLCGKIAEKGWTFLDRFFEDDLPNPWINATCLKVRRGWWIVSVTVIIAAGVNMDSLRRDMEMETGTSGPEPI